jgi:bifunctional polynucleotide phosphatase/kinase
LIVLWKNLELIPSLVNRTIVFQNGKRNDAAVGTLDEISPKKVKRVSEKTSVSLEYAKSGRSTCKGCSETIAKGAIRLGASAHDARGFDNTKWYHVACFPTSSYLAFPVENLKGFDSIKVCFDIL